MGLLVGSAVSAQTARLVLRWKDVPGASGYELQIAKDAAFIDMVLQTRTPTAGYRWEQLPTVMHWWRVRSFDADGRASEWSQPRTISIDTEVPLPKAPDDNATLACGATVTVSLEASALTREYLVTLSSSHDLTRPIELRSKVPELELPSLGVGTWYWRARGIDLRNRTSEPGPTRAFTIRVVAPSPKPTADAAIADKSVTLGWGEVPCAKSYLVEVSRDGHEAVTFSPQQPALVMKVGALGEVRWRVAGVDESGRPGEFSKETVFRVRLPAPVALREDVGARAELVWTSVATATSYRVELSRTKDFKVAESSGPLVTTTWRTGYLKSGSWWWRVSAKDASAHVSLPSEPRRFEVAARLALAAPDVASPVEGAVLSEGERDLDVAWSAVPQAVRYQLELDEVVATSTSAPVARLAALKEGRHVLRVRALADPDRESPWSPARDFYVGIPPVDRASVEQEGLEVRVELLDARGRTVAAARPVISVKSGQLSAPELRGGRWVARWDPPASGNDVLVVEERQFRLEQPLSPPVEAALWLAARGGGVFSGGAVASPTGVVAVTQRLPWLARRVGIEARLGVYVATSSLQVADVRFNGRAIVLPVTVAAAWHQPLGAFVLRGGAGVAVQVAWLDVGLSKQTAVAPGVELFAGLQRALGPGRLDVEVAFLYSRFDTPIARLNAGGIGVRVGYALGLSPRGR